MTGMIPDSRIWSEQGFVGLSAISPGSGNGLGRDRRIIH